MQSRQHGIESKGCESAWTEARGGANEDSLGAVEAARDEVQVV